jgi:hypothetical protein
MSREVSGAQWAELFSTFTHTAWRYECQGTYHEPAEAEPLRKFQAGEHDDLVWMRDWLDNVRAATAHGRHFQRVRVLTSPLTPYLRWEMRLAAANADAGEDVRVLDQLEALLLRLPSVDFWLFDNEAAAVMHFGECGFSSATLYSLKDTNDAAVVRTCRAIRDDAWANARPFTAEPRLARSV